jgi:hypothetical protein
MKLTPVNFDPFQDKKEPKLTPIDYDPLRAEATPKLTPVDYDPFPIKEVAAKESKLTKEPGLVQKGLGRVLKSSPFMMTLKALPGEGIQKGVRKFEEALGIDEPSEEISAIEAGKRGLAHGVLGLAETVGTGVQYLGAKEKGVVGKAMDLTLPYLSLVKKMAGEGTLGKKGKEVSAFWREKASKYAPPKELTGSILNKPDLLGKTSWWAFNVFDTLPSFAASLIPAAGATKYIQIGGKALSLTPKVIDKLSRLGGALVGGFAGGSLEGSHTFQEVLRRGGTEEEAAAAAEKMTFATAALNAISLNKMLGPARGWTGKAKHAVSSGTLESVTEWLEEPTEALILGDDVIDAMKKGVNVMPIAFLMGGGGSIVTSPTEEVSEVTPTEVPIEAPTAPVEAIIPEAPTQPIVEEMEAVEKPVTEKPLPPIKEDAIFNLEETERRIKNDRYVPERIPEEATRGIEGTDLETAQEITGRSLRTVPEENAVEYSGIPNPDRRREVATPIREAESEALGNWATENNKISPDFNIKVEAARTQGIEGGQENYVYQDKESSRWFKANRLTHSPTYSSLFNRVAMHNQFFPEAEYKFEGFTERDNELLPVFSQPDIIETEVIPDKELERLAAEELEKMGFRAETDFPGMVPATKFINDEGVVIHDINARNVAYVNGRVVFVDPIIEMDYRTKSERIIGKRAEDIFPPLIPSVEKEARVPDVVGILKSEKGQVKLGPQHAPRPEGLAGEVYDDLMAAKETSFQKRKKTLKKVFKKLRTSLIDVAGNTKAALNKLGNEGKKAVQRHIAYGGAHAKALQVADKVTQEVYGGLTVAEHDYLDHYIYAKRHLEIKKRKPDFVIPNNRTVEHLEAYIDSIPSDILPEIHKRAEAYWATMHDQLRQLADYGLLTDAQVKSLMATGKFYSPRLILDYVDPMRTSFEGGKKVTIPGSGIQKLSEEGTQKLVEGDTSLLLTQVISRTQSRIAKNRANQALWELAEAQPDNPIVRKAKIIKTTKGGKPVFQKAPQGWEKISLMIEGQHRELIMPEEFAGEWIFKDPILLHAERNFIQWATGTKVLKTMATGINPEFAFTNIPRDIALIWMSTEEYSPTLPVAMAQMGLDIKATFKDALMRKGTYDEYVNEGGGMEFLTHQGRFTPKIHGHLGRIQNVMGYLNETSEIMTRLAIRHRAIKNGASPEEATIIARNYLDFTQGGRLAKGADAALPYLNAGIQATRAMGRAAVTNPKLFSVKVAQVGGLATMLYLANRLINEDAWEEIPDRDKVNNWIITTPYSYFDKTGTKRYIYFKIAKDQGQRVFSAIFEGIAAKSVGDEVNTDQISMAVKDFIPFSPTNLPPTVDAILSYSANKDFWFNEDIWRGPEVRPEEEYTRYTPEVYKKIGAATGLSPERLKNSLQQLFTYGNIWTSLVGGGTKLLLNDLDDKSKDMVTQEAILKQPFVRKIVRSTDPYYKYGKEIEDVAMEARTEKFKITRDFDDYVQSYFDGDVRREKVFNYIKEQPVTERKRLVQRFKKHERMKDIPERRFWIELLYTPPKARAYVYWGRWKMADAKEREVLKDMSHRLPGFRGRMFNYHLQRLRRGEGEQTR